MLVVQQPDGTMTHIPEWMCSPAAAALDFTQQPRLSLAALRILRLEIDTVLSSFMETSDGERHDPGKTSISTRPVRGTAGALGPDCAGGEPETGHASGNAFVGGGQAERDAEGGL